MLRSISVLERRPVEVPFGQIFHLEIFKMGDEEFIKDSSNPHKGNVVRRSGKRDYVSLSPETLVQRKGPDVPLIAD